MSIRQWADQQSWSNQKIHRPDRCRDSAKARLLRLKEIQIFAVVAFTLLLLIGTHYAIRLTGADFFLNGSTPAPSGRLTGPMPEE